MDQTWEYSKDHSPSAPVVKALIAGLPFELLIDTGFAGGVLLPFPTFQALGFAAKVLPKPDTLVLGDGRRTPVYTAPGELTIGGARVPAKMHSSPYVDLSLIGRQALTQMVVTLDGPRENIRVRIAPAEKAK